MCMHCNTVGCNSRTPVRPMHRYSFLGSLHTLVHPITPLHSLVHPRTPSHTLAHPRIPSRSLAHPHTPSYSLAHRDTPSHTVAYPRTPSRTLAHPRTFSHTFRHSLSHIFASHYTASISLNAVLTPGGSLPLWGGLFPPSLLLFRLNVSELPSHFSQTLMCMSTLPDRKAPSGAARVSTCALYTAIQLCYLLSLLIHHLRSMWGRWE